MSPRMIYEMARRYDGRAGRTTGVDRVDPILERFFQQRVDGHPSLVVAGANTEAEISPSASESNTHGGFDNDTKTMNAVLYRILGRKPAVPFTDGDLYFE